MSAKDDLDRFDESWERHMRWRRGTLGNDNPRYLSERRELLLTDLPNSLRELLLEGFEQLVSIELDRLYLLKVSELKIAAIDEARRTLDVLGAQR